MEVDADQGNWDPLGYPRRNGETGALLVEVTIASLIMIIALAAFVMVAMHMGALRKTDEQLSYAFTACRNTLEEVRAVPITAVAALHGSGFDVDGPKGPGALQPPEGDPDGLPGLISVAVESQTPLATLFRVTATVEWIGANGRQQFQLQALIGERQ